MHDLNSAIRSRTWVLLAIDACDRVGLTPVPKTLFHRLIFLSNCLAALFHENSPSKRIVKYKRGPFYPDVQWELDRLASMGLLSINSLRIEEDIHGPWMDASYGICDQGIRIVESFKSTFLGTQTSLYINELVSAFARMNEDGYSDLALKELNYSAPGIAQGALITFDDSDSNLALRKASDFVRLAPDLLDVRYREQMHLYLRYIEKGETAA